MKSLKQKITLWPQNKKTPYYALRLITPGGRKIAFCNPKHARLVLALMNMQAASAGVACHWGGPSAFIEILSALYAWIFYFSRNTPWHEKFHLINDAGHAENAHYVMKALYRMGGLTFEDLKGFRSVKSPLSGHGEAGLFPQGVYLSNGPLASTFAQAQGLSLADRMQEKKRICIVLLTDGGSMEGEAKEAFASIPGLYAKNKMNPFIAILSDNNCKLSGHIDSDSFSQDPYFRSLKTQGWEYKDLKNPHHLASTAGVLEEVFTRRRNFQDFKKPLLIRARTLKGYGVKATEKTPDGGHAFPLKKVSQLRPFLEEINKSPHFPPEIEKWCRELETQGRSSKKSSPSEDIFPERAKIQAGISEAMIYCKRTKKLPIVSISSDLPGSTGTGPFRTLYPDHSFDMGVAEANMVSVASGLSKQGFIPVVDTFTQFGLTKGALPLFMAGLSNAPVIAVFSHAGLQPAGDGASHQNLSYFSQSISIPNLKVHCLSSKKEAFHLLTQALIFFAKQKQKGKAPHSHVFFLGREEAPTSYFPQNHPYKLDQSHIVFSPTQDNPALKNAFRFSFPRTKKRGKSITILACGPLLEEALKATRSLLQQGWFIIVLNPSIIHPLDTTTLRACLKKTNGNLLTVEDHHLTGGLGSLAAHQLALLGVKVQLQSLAIRSAFGRSAYKASHLYKTEKLLAKDIEKHIKSTPFWL